MVSLPALIAVAIIAALSPDVCWTHDRAILPPLHAGEPTKPSDLLGSPAMVTVGGWLTARQQALATEQLRQVNV